MTNIPIFLASDDNYAPFVASTIASICDNTESFIDFYVFDTNITLENKEKIITLKNKFNNFSVEFLPLTEEKILQNFKNKINFEYLSLATYSRFFISEFKPNLKRALYIDIDVVILDDIKELFDYDLNGRTAGLALDHGSNEFVEDFKNKAGLKNYFNAGVFLIDLDRWNKLDYTKKSIEISKEYIDIIKFQDQDILNILLQNDFTRLPYRYNCQYGGEKTLLRHFVNTFKPWKTNFFKIGNSIEPLSNFDDFWKYIKMTEFYNDIKQKYEENINSNILVKRMSVIADKIKKEKGNV